MFHRDSIILTAEAIKNASNDEELLQLLSNELQRHFPSEVQSDIDSYIAALKVAPVGLRAMAAVHPLDESMTLDDLAWHFGNQDDDRLLEETIEGLKVLGADEAAHIFTAAWEIIKPFLPEIRSTDWQTNDPSDYFERTGIQSKVDPLSQRMSQICDEAGQFGLMQYWVTYARHYPEKCVSR
jgi:hypothetical protein